MARIPYFDLSQATGRAARHLESKPRMREMNLFRMLGHSGELLDGWTRLGVQILSFLDLDPVLREIAILRVGFLSDASYEIHQHKRVARDAGLSDALILAVEAGPDAAGLDELQSLVVRFTDEVAVNVRATDETFEALARHLPYKQLQELLVTIGYYMMVCRFLETFDVDIEPRDAPSAERGGPN